MVTMGATINKAGSRPTKTDRTLRGSLLQELPVEVKKELAISTIVPRGLSWSISIGFITPLVTQASLVFGPFAINQILLKKIEISFQKL
ncbi:MAG: hypothetical protein AAFR07_06110 [Pseudomonadota bacterium]